MSLPFSNPTTKGGIVELIDANCKSNSVSYPLKEKVRDANLAMDSALAIIFDAGGTWQFDDNNHTTYPIIRTNLVDGQRDYAFVADDQGNLILDIYKVFIKDQNDIIREVFPVDVQTQNDTQSFTDGTNVEGTPYRYDKTGNGFFLDPIPSYNKTLGLIVYVDREASYFTSSDTTKKPGIAGLFHEYIALRPSYFYAMRNSLKNVNKLQEAMLKMEQAMREYYGKRERDTRPVLRERPINFI